MQTILVANRKGGVGKTLVSVTLASMLAAEGGRVALADADAQQSALGWLSLRPADAVPIKGLAWDKPSKIGDCPKKLDWLVIDAPGALKDSRAADLIAEARAVLTPLQPGLFDRASTARFLDDIEDLKRVRKGKVVVHLVANRVRAGARAARAVDALVSELGRPVIARIPERTAYGDLAARGLSVFDSERATHRRLREDWTDLRAVVEGR